MTLHPGDNYLTSAEYAKATEQRAMVMAERSLKDAEAELIRAKRLRWNDRAAAAVLTFVIVCAVVLAIVFTYNARLSNNNEKRTDRFDNCVGQHVPADECAKAASGVK